MHCCVHTGSAYDAVVAASLVVATSDLRDARTAIGEAIRIQVLASDAKAQQASAALSQNPSDSEVGCEADDTRVRLHKSPATQKSAS